MDYVRYLILYNIFTDKVEGYRLVNIGTKENVNKNRRYLLNKQTVGCVILEANSCGKVLTEEELKKICKRILIHELLPKDKLYHSIMMSV